MWLDWTDVCFRVTSSGVSCWWTSWPTPAPWCSISWTTSLASWRWSVNTTASVRWRRRTDRSSGREDEWRYISLLEVDACVCVRVCVRVCVASTPVDSRVSCGQSVNKYAGISISLNLLLQGTLREDTPPEWCIIYVDNCSKSIYSVRKNISRAVEHNVIRLPYGSKENPSFCIWRHVNKLWSQWLSGQRVVEVLVFRVMGSIPTPSMVRFWSLGNFIYPNLPRYTQLQLSTVPTLLGRYLRWTSVLSRRVSTTALLSCLHYWNQV